MQWSGPQPRGGQQQASPATGRQRQQHHRSASRQQTQHHQQQQRLSQQHAAAQAKLGAAGGAGSGPQQGGECAQAGQSSSRPEWLNEYELMGKIGEGTYGLVYLARNKDKSRGSGRTAIKKLKQAKEGEGVSPTAIREIMLLRECQHDNIVKLVNVHINHTDMSLYLAFDYAEHDFYEVIRYHRDVMKNTPMKEYTVKSFLWQLLNGLNYLHANWIVHRDLKPSNILVMGEGDEHGVVKIADFGLARIFQAPLQPLSSNGVVVTIWYRAPELLLGSFHYTCAVDMWAVGCIFAEMLALKPLFQGIEDKTSQHAFQLDQLEKIFRVLGHPTQDKWPMLQFLPHWRDNRKLIQERKFDHPTLRSVLPSSISAQALSLLQAMLEYDPKKRITAAQALEHDYFKCSPLPGRNAFLSGAPGEKAVPYPARPVDRSTDLEKGGQPPQPPSQQQQQRHHPQQPQHGEQHPGSLQDQHQHASAGGRLALQHQYGQQQQQQQPTGRQGAGSAQTRTTRERSSLGAPMPKTRRL